MLAARQAGAQGQITLGVRGASAVQPGLVVLAGPGLDSVRTIVQRDLMNSDRFTMAPLSDSAGTLTAPLDPATLKDLGLTWAVELQPAIGGVVAKLYDVATGVIRQQQAVPVDPGGVGDTRLTIHRLSDLIVTWTGGIGIAATRIAFKIKNGSDDAIWRIDGDGANLVRITRPGAITMTPAWSPDGGTLAYSEFRDGRWTLYLLKLATGTRTAVTSSSPGNSYGGNFSPGVQVDGLGDGLERGAAIEPWTSSGTPRAHAHPGSRLRRQCLAELFAGRAAHSIYFQPDGNAAGLGHGPGRRQPRTAGSVRHRGRRTGARHVFARLGSGWHADHLRP